MTVLASWILGMAAPAWACGGFFCDNVDPVVQSEERILFQQDPTGEWTTFVEVQFQGPPSEFAWVIPVERVLDPETAIEVAAAGLFDELEGLTAPRFVPAGAGMAAPLDMVAGGTGCGCGGRFPEGSEGFFATVPDTSGVEVVGDAVVGPFAIEMITAEQGDNLTAWLQLNGYRMPSTAIDPIQAYIDLGWSFVGVKLQPDVPEGPIDTLVLRCGASRPAIPLLLTAIAAVPQMPITVYVQGEGRYAPAHGWVDVPFDFGGVHFVDAEGATDYLEQLQLALGEAERGFVTEHSQPVSALLSGASEALFASLAEGGGTLTRLRTFVSPEQMTVDPGFMAAPKAPEVGNVHVIDPGIQAGAGLLGAVWLVGVVGLGAACRRRERRGGDAVPPPGPGG